VALTLEGGVVEDAADVDEPELHAASARAHGTTIVPSHARRLLI